MRKSRKTEPEKSLISRRKKTGGRNHTGWITCRHIGGGNKQFYRKIDFKRKKDGVKATVAAIEYDPNRSVFIALLKYEDGELRYILAPAALKVGDVVESGTNADIEKTVGNAMPLDILPVGLEIHNVEMVPGAGGEDLPVGGRGGAADRQGCGVCDDTVAIGRGEADQLQVPGDDRTAREH